MIKFTNSTEFTRGIACRPTVILGFCCSCYKSIPSELVV